MRPRLPAFLAVVALAVAACGGVGSSEAAPSVSGDSAPSGGSSSAAGACAVQVFASMSEAKRVGQLFMVGLRNDRLGPAEIAGIRRYHFGSVWFTQTTSAGVARLRSVADAVQAQATRANTARVGFYVAANQEGGLIQALRGRGFARMPTAVDQGKLSPSALATAAATWGRQLAAAGVNLNFAPVMDVVPAGTESRNRPIGALQREYGSSPSVVGTHGVAFLQGMARANVATVAKHFPGLGRVKGNTDFTAKVVDSVTTPNDPYLRSFRQAIDAGVPMVMVALATYTRIDPNHLAAFSPVVMSLLRHDGFNGVILSDDLGATAAVSRIPPQSRAIKFLEAGGDLIVVNSAQTAGQMAEAILDKAGSSPAFRAKVGAAVMRVLRAKEASRELPCH